MKPGNSILLDVGTTTMAIAHALLAREDLDDVTIITNGLTIALELETAGQVKAGAHEYAEAAARAAVAAAAEEVAAVQAKCDAVAAELAERRQAVRAAEDERATLLAGRIEIYRRLTDLQLELAGLAQYSESTESTESTAPSAPGEGSPPTPRIVGPGGVLPGVVVRAGKNSHGGG